MEDQRLGAVIRLVRTRRGWRQVDLARAAGVSQATVSRIERGHLGTVSLNAIRAVAAALDIRVDLRPLWRGGDLDRLLNARHSALHEQVAQRFAGLEGWMIEPEVSFGIYGERGVVDILAWHAGRNALLVVELKTEIVDVNELVGTLDRKRRLAPQIARERGWSIGRDVSVSTWVCVVDNRTNRRHVQAHATMLRAAFPSDGREIKSWLRRPGPAVRCLGFWSGPVLADGAAGKRVRRPDSMPDIHPRNVRRAAATS